MRDEMALGVLVRVGGVTAVTVRSQPLRLTGLFRASGETVGHREVPALVATLRRKLRVAWAAPTVVVLEEAYAAWAARAGRLAQLGGAVPVSVLGDGPAPSARVLVPPELAEQLDRDVDLHAIAAAAARLHGRLRSAERR